MRALFFHASHDWTGGARAFADTATGLAARGYQVLYVCPPESAVEQHVVQTGIEVVPMDVEGGWLAVAMRLRRVLLDRFVEVGFVHTEREQLVVATATRLADRGAVVRRTPVGDRLRLRAPSRAAMRLAATGFVFPSRDEIGASPTVPKRALCTIEAELGVDAERYDEVRAVSRASLASGPDTRLIVCVCDPAGTARIATALRTVALLAPRHPELRIVLVGPGSDSEDLRMHAAALGITRIVSHLGERDDHLAVLKAADIGWVAAERDDAAYAFLDFMALRTPVLAERWRVSQRYVADGISGILLPPGDAAATAATVARVLAHDDERAAMGNAARLRVAREFSASASVDAFVRATEAARDRTRWQR